MKLLLASISARRGEPAGPAGELVRLYADRMKRYTPFELRSFATEAKLLEYVAEASARTRAVLWLTESRGEMVSSEEMAAALDKVMDGGAQQMVLAIGPADGWSDAARRRADKMLAFGRITLPHELAAVIAAEQLYRAMTIRAGHPYHSGH
jgi:23S rRNA (pseudouridine1915-N3)-methyltransferase